MIVRKVGSTIPLSKLDIDSTNELVRLGFSETLGLEVEARVPLLIFEYTAGHPAFVQYFCHRILIRLSSRDKSSAPKVTESEADAVFNEGHSMAFIYFVEKTLDMNLAPLEKIIVYIIAAALVGKKGDARKPIERTKIDKAVNNWFSDLGEEKPSIEELDRAFRYLTMTGMVEKMGQASDSYRIAFRSYAEILIRLEEAKKDVIDELVRMYRRLK